MNKQEIEKAIEDLNGLIAISLNEDYEKPSDAAYELAETYRLAISALEQQLTGGWIPVSKRKPNDGELVLLAVIIDEQEQTVGKWNQSLKKWEIGNDAIGWDWEKDSPVERVMAWQPLPEPYKEVSE